MNKHSIFYILVILAICANKPANAQENNSVYTLADTAYADSLLIIGDSLYTNSQAERGLDLTKEAKDILVAIFGDIHSDVAVAWEQIGVGYYRLGQNKKSIASYENALNIYLETEGEQYHKVGEMYNNFGVLNSNSGNFKKSLVYHKKALAFKKRYDPENLKSLGSSYGNIGATYQYLSLVDSAIYFHQKSLALRKIAFGEKSIKVADALNSIGSSYQQLGQYDKEIEFLHQAKEIFESVAKETNYNRILCYTNLGFAYKNAGNFSKTLHYHQLALDLNKKKNGKKSIGIAIAYNNLSSDYIHFGKFRLAKTNIENAFKSLPEDFPMDHPHVGTFYNQLARCYSEIGDNRKAIDIYEKSLNIALKKYGANNSKSLYAYHNLGIMYADNQEYEKAIKCYNLAYEAHSNNFDEIHPNVPYFYGGLGNAYLDLGNYTKAEAYHQKVLEIERALNVDTLTRFSFAYKNLAWIQFKKGNYAKSTEGLLKSIRLGQEAYEAPSPQMAYNYLLLANSLSKEEKYQEAEQAFDNSFKAYNYILKNEFEKVNRIDGLISVLIDKGLFHKEKYKTFGSIEDLNKSSEQFQEALNAVAFKSSQISPESKNTLGKRTREIYAHLLSNTYTSSKSAILTEEQNEQIFEYSERSKAYILLNAFLESKALQIAGIPKELVEKEFDLRVEIASLEKLKQLNTNAADTVILNISNQIADLKVASELLKKQFEVNHPEYYSARYDQSISTITSVQNEMLHQDQSLIEYVTGDSTSYLLLVNPDTFIVHEIHMDFSLKERVTKLRESLTQYHSTKGMPRSQLSLLTKDYVRTAQQLYKKLILPIASNLNKEIIIIPDGLLGYIPFEILLSEEPTDISSFHTYPYFLKNHNISYCYSATLLAEMKNRKHRQAPSKSALAIAPFYDESMSSTINKSAVTEIATFRSDTLQALPHSGEETIAVANITSGEKWLGSNATLDRFIKQAPDYRILHLSTHGIASDNIGDYAYLAFRNIKAKNEYDKLLVKDIYNIPLNADMVVLSACKTAYGKLQKGEGIISMARAFAYAGSKSIITSHWNIDDKSTGTIMKEFYRQLGNQKTKDESLKIAKLKFMENNKGLRGHPFYWAAFIAIGDMSSIQKLDN